jgi:hypothetical protein
MRSSTKKLKVLRLLPLTGFVFIFLCLSSVQSAQKSFLQELVPFIKKYCWRCHKGEKPKGDFHFSKIQLKQITSEKGYHAWESVLEQLSQGDMPPESKKLQPLPDESQKVIALIKKHLANSKIPEVPRTGLRRLTKTQYKNTVEDLLKIDLDKLSTNTVNPLNKIPSDFRVDSLNVLDRNLQVSDTHLQSYLDAARTLLDIAQFDKNKVPPRKLSYPKDDTMHILENPDLIITPQYSDIITRSDIWRGELRTWYQAPVKGWYKISCTVEALHRFAEKSMGKLYHLPDYPQVYHAYRKHQLGIYISGDYYHVKNRFDVATHVLEDNKKQQFEHYVYMPQGSHIQLEFDNGPHMSGGSLYANLIKSKNVYQRSIDYPDFKERVKNATTPRIRVHEVTMDGPYYHEWPTASHKAALGDGSETDEAQLRKFADKAFRRPLNKTQIAPFIDYMNEHGLRAAIEVILSSPNFLYLHENETILDDHALASRLSYTLWNTMPDDELRELADQGQLRTPKILNQQIERLLNDARSFDFVKSFTYQWLNFQNISILPPVETKFPLYKKQLNHEHDTMHEVYYFMKELIDKNLSIANLIDSDFTMLNDDLALWYGIKDFHGHEFKKYTYPTQSNRGGLLGMLAVLTASANGVDTSPVVRGIFVLDKLLGQKPSEPPPNTPAIGSDVRGTKTIKERFKKHRENTSCNRCHKYIDPIGFALENFDAIGAWRDTYWTLPVVAQNVKVPGLAIDPSGRTHRGQKFKDFNGLKKLMKRDLDAVTLNLTRRLLSYAAGREMKPNDDKEIKRIAKLVKSKAYGFRSLVKEVMLSEIVRHR